MIKIMTWGLTGYMTLSETLMIQFTNAYMHAKASINLCYKDNVLQGVLKFETVDT